MAQQLHLTYRPGPDVHIPDAFLDELERLDANNIGVGRENTLDVIWSCEAEDLDGLAEIMVPTFLKLARVHGLPVAHTQFRPYVI